MLALMARCLCNSSDFNVGEICCLYRLWTCSISSSLALATKSTSRRVRSSSALCRALSSAISALSRLFSSSVETILSANSWRTMSAMRSRSSLRFSNNWTPAARFTKHLTTVLRLSYDNVKVTIDLRRTSNLQNILRRAQGFFKGTIHLQSCKIVWGSVRKLAYDIPKRNFSTF